MSLDHMSFSNRALHSASFNERQLMPQNILVAPEMAAPTGISAAPLAFGDELTYRKLIMGDAPMFEAHLRILDPASRRMRFGMLASDAFLSEYAARCISINAIIHGAFHAGELVGVAELRPMGTIFTREIFNREAEIAFSVLADWRNHGIGTALFARTLRSARNRGYSKLYMTCLRHNAPMQALARKFSAEIMLEMDESVAYVETPRRTIISLFREAMEDARLFNTIAFEWQRQALEKKALEKNTTPTA